MYQLYTIILVCRGGELGSLLTVYLVDDRFTKNTQQKKKNGDGSVLSYVSQFKDDKNTGS